MPDAYFDSNLNGNLRTESATRTLVVDFSTRPLDANLLAFTATPYYFDSNVSTLRTDTVARTQIVINTPIPDNTNSLAITNAPASLPYKPTRSPTVTSRFTD